ncbi:hypothetical protein B9Z65_2601 [Elsinoe australis]|uniref:Carrier domain-containing protein n=1 Tax=Elsinoe australis TaxID=40998 RepID=A0A2P8A422_9PEZI|nr:hypothetical protein B9Z65_2601 [Elsinoe australis]
MASPSYFTCTLGQATSLGLTNPDFKNISQLIDDQAEKIPDQPAVGFAIPPAGSSNSQSWSYQIHSFRSLSRKSIALAVRLNASFKEQFADSKTVALLCPSTPEFLFTWLALMRLGYAVLLIAPQCQPAAIAHLCDSCEVTALVHDEQYSEQGKLAAEAAKEKHKTLEPLLLPNYGGLSIMEVSVQVGGDQFSKAEATDVAYLHHTSGTSSGLPKPIPQTHRAGAGVLPSFPHGHQTATFTTTPLYHGGIADAFRAWTSGALIWLFPGKGVPITASNIIHCLDVATELSQAGKAPTVKYFSSVPYVLQSMEADERGLQLLKGMDIVGVGGAALPAEVGDRLTQSGVNLISRFGSAECGFLMSSHRDYDKDKEWQYLRSDIGSECLQFEKQEDDLVELVIKKGWPHMAKHNRDDDSFATADLFAPHPTIANAWRYHSRADSQLTLITGKKFDPAPLENAIATSPLLSDVLIFGNSQPYPGALLFRSPSSTSLSDADLLARLWPTISDLNAKSQDHARLLKKALIPMPAADPPLEKSSKGTILRPAAEARFKAEISGAYADTADEKLDSVPDEKLLETITGMIQTTANRKSAPGRDADLFAYGVDSVAGMQIRNGVRQLVPAGTKVPLNVVEDCGTVERLVEWVLGRRRGEEGRDVEGEERGLMLELVEEYGKFKEGKVDGVNGVSESGDGGGREVVVLTGVTGALGAHVLDLYSRDEKVGKVYVLVRGATEHACRERVVKALEARGLRRLHDKVVILQSQLGEEKLGLSDEVYTRLARKATKVLHVAWAVNFRMRLRAFVKDHIGGLTNLIALCLSSPRTLPPTLGFCSSVASVQAHTPRPIPETIISDPAAASPLGYSRSKWVAEQICAAAARETRLAGRIAVFRVGQLGGDSERGVWNATEAWPLMMSVGVKTLRAMPDLGVAEGLDWLPVDVAARALVEGMDQGLRLGTISKGEGDGGSVSDGAAAGGLRRGLHSRADEDGGDGDVAGRDDGSEMKMVDRLGDEQRGPDVMADGTGRKFWPTKTTNVMHVVHDGPNPNWTQMLGWLQEERGQGSFKIVDPAEWVRLLEQASEMAAHDSSVTSHPGGNQDGKAQVHTHPAFKLLDLWKSAYGGGQEESGETQDLDEKAINGDSSEGSKTFAMEKTKAAIPVLEDLRPVDEGYVIRIWRWIDQNM